MTLVAEFGSLEMDLVHPMWKLIVSRSELTVAWRGCDSAMMFGLLRG